MRVLIADKFEQAGIAELEGVGCVVTSNPDLSADDLAGAVGERNPEVLVVRSTKVHGPVFEHGAALQLVVRAGAGYDNIDVGAASARGVAVANCPGKNAIAVAELAWGLIISADRRIADQTADLRAGVWNKKLYGKSHGLFGRTLGVIGVGNIGREVIHRAHAFGMPVQAWSRSLDEAGAEALGVRRCESPIEAARGAHVVSVHVAATPDTEKLISTDLLAAMSDGAILVNTARGKVVDEQALEAEVTAGRLRAALDVYRDQPTPSDSTSDIGLAKAADPSANHVFVGTHHCGASTDQSQHAIAMEAVRIVRELKSTGSAPNVVNMAERGTATRLLVVRHHNQPGVLAHIIGAIGAAGVNIERMRNVIFDGGAAACATIRLDTEPASSVIEAINDASKHVISVSMGVVE